MIYDIFSSPLGKVVISTNGTHLTGFHFIGQKHFNSIPSDWTQDSQHPLLLSAIKQITEYFEGKRKQFDLPVLTEGTSFQKDVWDEIAKIPYGVLTTYSSIAKNIGKPRAVRAVGTAIGKNPLAIVIPCHRIVGMQGAITGYAGGVDRKQKLLSLEGCV